MVLIVNKVDQVDRTGPPALYFVLEPKYASGIDVTDIDNFHIRPQSHDSPYIKEILTRNLKSVREVLALALDGQPGKAIFNIDSGGYTLHYELHCFPLPGFDSSGVGCFLIDRSIEKRNQAAVNSRIYELGLISQAVRAFAETRNLSEILRIILLAVTAGTGLGFNRGFILLSDDARECLWGCMGTGPSSPEEAGIIWNQLSRTPLTFDEVLRQYKAGGAYDAQVNSLILSIKIPLSGETDFIARAALEKRSVIVGPEMIQNDDDRSFFAKLGVDQLAVVPLLSKDSLQGVILADNIITRRSILPSDLHLLEIFAKYASDAIENSRLYGKLEHQVELLKEANENIIESRENLIRAEKLSSIGRMALVVAHEIRNPLTIIGGYANLRLRKMPPEDGSRHTLELISKQVGRIEKTLDHFTSVVKMSGKKEDKFLIVELIKETLGMLFSDPNSPECRIDENVGNSRIFVDKGLFHQAMMAVLREAARIAGGIGNISLDITRNEEYAIIFIDGGENNPKFAENFYSGLKDRKEEERYQDMAVAIEILRHYGGDIGIGTSQGVHGRLYIHIPLGEEKT